MTIRRAAAAAFGVALACLAGAVGVARADAQTDAIALVQQVRQTTIALSEGGSDEVVAAQKASIGAAFDGQQIGRTVLGMYWTSASASDRTAVVAALLDAIAERLAGRVGRTRERDFVVLGTQVLTNGDILVRSRFERPVRRPTTVDWRLRLCQGNLCIGDVIVDGASVTITRRDQVTARLAGNGGSIPRLIVDLREGRL